jgi:hypothetical protein
VIFQVRTQILQVEATVNRPQQVIGRNMILKIEAVEKSILVTLLLPHHLGHPILLMRLAYYSMVGFSTASTQTRRSRFSKPASQPNPESANWNATKQPLAGSPNRPVRVIRPLKLSDRKRLILLKNAESNFSGYAEAFLPVRSPNAERLQRSASATGFHFSAEIEFFNTIDLQRPLRFRGRLSL